jgi:hypothetical protein
MVRSFFVTLSNISKVAHPLELCVAGAVDSSLCRSVAVRPNMGL